MGQEEATSSSKGIALTCDEHNKMKGKLVETSSSSSSSSEDEDEDDDEDDDDEESDDQASTSSSDDEEVMQLIGVKRMLCKMRAKGVPSQLKISCLPTKEEGKERMDALVAVERGTLWRIIETSVGAS